MNPATRTLTGGHAVANLQTRVMNILKTPATEWPVIAGESTDVGRLYTEYIMPMSAIPVVATFIGFSFIRTSLVTAGVRLSTMNALSFAIVNFLMGLAVVYICALVIEWLAPKFKSSGSRLDALKLVAYASTASWVAGAFNAIPYLGILSLVGLIYSIYLFYLGLPHLMKTPADQVVIFMIVSAIVMIVLSVVLGAIAAAMTIGSTIATLR